MQPGVKVYLQGERLKIKNFEDYCKLYLSGIARFVPCNHEMHRTHHTIRFCHSVGLFDVDSASRPDSLFGDFHRTSWRFDSGQSTQFNDASMRIFQRSSGIYTEKCCFLREGFEQESLIGFISMSTDFNLMKWIGIKFFFSCVHHYVRIDMDWTKSWVQISGGRLTEHL